MRSISVTFLRICERVGEVDLEDLLGALGYLRDAVVAVSGDIGRGSLLHLAGSDRQMGNRHV